MVRVAIEYKGDIYEAVPGKSITGGWLCIKCDLSGTGCQELHNSRTATQGEDLCGCIEGYIGTQFYWRKA